MFLDSFVLLLPILFLSAGGYFLAKLTKISVETLVRVVTDFLMPLLIFYSLYTSNVSAKTVLSLAGSVTFVVFGLMGLTLVYCKISGYSFREFSPPVLFMNSGFLGIPLMQLWGGTVAMNYIVVYDQIQTIFIFSLGILIVTGGFSISGIKETIKSPILWAIFLGFLWRGASLPVPQALLQSIEFGGRAAPPLAAVTLGVSLYGRELHFNFHLIIGIILRIFIGFFIALLSIYIFNIKGIPRTVILVASALPSAVFSSVLPIRYGVKAEFASTMVAVTTIIGFITIPVSFSLASLF